MHKHGSKYVEFNDAFFWDAPRTLDNFEDFSSGNGNIKPNDEKILLLPMGEDVNYAITNYGRILNVDIKKFVKIEKRKPNPEMNDIYNLVFISIHGIDVQENILIDYIRKTFFTKDIYRTHKNIRFRDSNKFNFRLDNIVFLEDIFYDGVLYEDSRMEPIMYNNEPTNYEINLKGVIYQKSTKKVQGKDKQIKANDIVSIKVKNKYIELERYKWMGQTFIKNDHNFKNCVLVNPKKITPSIMNIKWTDRISSPVDF